MERDSFVFYRSFRDALDKVSEEDFSKCMRVLLSLALDGEEYTGDDPIVYLFYSLVAPQIKANNKRYEDGKKGGRPKKPQVSENKTTGFENGKPLVSDNENHWLGKSKPNVNVNVNDNALSIESESEKPLVTENKTTGLENRNQESERGSEASRISNIDTIFKDFTSSATFEQLMMANGMTAEEGVARLREFTSDCKLRGDELMTIKEYRVRFAKWLNYNKKYNQNQQPSSPIAKGW